MFRDMRRKNQQMSEKEAIKVLSNSSYGVLGLIGDGGYPYTVPLNYIFCDGKVYFHCASEGHKIDSVKNDDRASFCVVENLPQESIKHDSKILKRIDLRLYE